MGFGKCNDDGIYFFVEVKVGDKVFYFKYVGIDIKFGGDDYVLLIEKDILVFVV